jgi:hypothetical protein
VKKFKKVAQVEDWKRSWKRFQQQQARKKEQGG